MASALANLWFRENPGNNPGAVYSDSMEPLEVTVRLDGDMAKGEWWIGAVQSLQVYVIETYTRQPGADLCTQYRDSFSRARSIQLDVNTTAALVAGSPDRISFKAFIWGVVA